ncbi:MAG: hypothetical protein NWF14_09650, partial [Candidatus Bathyarchaeota archaeon]|nr:hypothetical protein [Candidatus Bathyarchaeota archaeon]
MRSIVLKDGAVVSPSGVLRSDVLVKGGHISRVEVDLSGGETIDCKECYVLPGFRDQHIHDLNGFMNHVDNPERLGKVSRALASQGVTVYMVATTAAPTKKLVTYLRTIG